MPFKITPKYYNVWKDMRSRCTNPKDKAYKDYGGRGITVCDRWMHDYKAFEADMGERPKGYSIDRVENDKGYYPENCRWADRRTQQRNQRRAVYVTIDGTQHRAIELADISGLKTDTIIERAARGLSYASVIDPEKHHNLSGLSLGGKASGAKKLSRAHCRNGHEFTEETTYWRKDNTRQCRICHNEKMRRLQKQWRAERV
ncbi:hypothetical protein E0H46_31705 [Rhizobium leguminosarum bv. viciae]|nr:hypothetical protein E0H46_31705 [Rhizobium leguminosarum bv. viciae]